MSSSTLVILVSAAFAVVVVVVLLLLRRRIQEALFPGSGAREWADTAAGLNLRERWAVERANTRGRAAPRPLARAAALRGRRNIIMIDRLLTKGTGVRRFWLGLAVLWSVLLIFQVAYLVEDPTRGARWTQVALSAYFLVLIWYFTGPAQRRLRSRTERSITLNEEQLADGDPLSRR